MEKWKHIPLFNGEFSASNMGNIRRNCKTYISKMPSGRNRITKLGEKLCSCRKPSKKGYLRVRINKKTWFIHTLIALTWIPKIEGKNQINHRNGIKSDNSVANLEWVSNFENRQHAKNLGLIASRKTGLGLSLELCKEIVKKYTDDKLLQREIALEYGVCQQTISKILRDKKSFS